MVKITLFSVKLKRKKKTGFTIESFDSASLSSGDCFPKLRCHLPGEVMLDVEGRSCWLEVCKLLIYSERWA